MGGSFDSHEAEDETEEGRFGEDGGGDGRLSSRRSWAGGGTIAARSPMHVPSFGEKRSRSCGGEKEHAKPCNFHLRDGIAGNFCRFVSTQRGEIWRLARFRFIRQEFGALPNLSPLENSFGSDYNFPNVNLPAEPRFLWNGYLLEPLIESKLDQYLLPVFQGSFQNIHAEVGSEKVTVTMIARRCTRRIGTRCWRRGADPEGYAANFVESEQIMQSKGFTASYVQVRGSMPFLWEQIVDLTYKPSFDVIRVEEAARVLERHFHDLQKRYGAVVAIDLVNSTGAEGRLYKRYEQSIEPILSEDIRFVHFDFHKICGHIHFERLSQLYDQIEDYLKKHKYFLLNEEGKKTEEQTGTVRTNCIDCLDRTNVTQSMVGRKILESQLQRLGVLGANDTISKYPAFDADYKVLWANHGDAISTQYSGTPALKGDFVRYGKRTTQGIFNDLWNALERYYLNNFADGTKQDAMDLLQGHYVSSVSRDIAVPGKPGALESFRIAFALILVAAMFMMISLLQARNDLRHLVVALVWAGLCIGITQYVKKNGRKFCNRPRFFLSRH